MIITDKAHSGSLVKGLQASFQEQKFCDIKIKCDGKIIKCHRAVLCQFSTVLRSLVSDESTTPETVGIIGMEYCQLESLIKFMYFGRIKVNKEDINTTLKCAEDLGMEALVRFAHDNFKDLRDDSRSLNESSPAILSPSITNGVDSSARKRPADEMSHQKTGEEDILSSSKKARSDIETLNVLNNERDRREQEKKVLNSKPLQRNNENNLSNTMSDEISLVKPNDENLASDPDRKKVRNDSESRSNDFLDKDKERKKSNLEQVPSSRGYDRQNSAMNITNNDDISILSETTSERKKPKAESEMRATDVSEKEREKQREVEKTKVTSNKPCPLSKVRSENRNNLSVSGDEIKKAKVDEMNENTEKMNTSAPAAPSMVQCAACKKSYKSNLTHKKLDVSELGADKKCGYDGCSKPVKFKRALIDHLSRDHKIDICNPEEKS